MSYFSKRNKYVVEYSGHEEISPSLRDRIKALVGKYVDNNPESYGMSEPWCIERSDFQHAVRQEFPNKDVSILLEGGEFHEVFSIAEIFHDMLPGIYHVREAAAKKELSEAFRLSGSVYDIQSGRICLKLEKDTASKIEEAKAIFSPYEKWYKTFFEAVGDLVGRRAKPEDVVKNIFIATEGYLKEITGKTRYSEAVTHLHSTGKINREQKAVMDKLYAYRSDAAGAGHAGNSASPTEADAVWYLESMLAQLRNIHRKLL
jgi:hypothetical protein